MSTQKGTPQELLERHFGAIVEEEHAALRDGPGPVPLSEAFNELTGRGAYFASSRPGELRTVGAVGISEGSAQVLRYWKQWVSAWYWGSPMAILECDVCAELSLVGSKKTKRCKRYECGGTYRAIEPPFQGKRPRRRTVKAAPENVEHQAEADIAAGNLGEPMTVEQAREAMTKLRRLADRVRNR